MSFILVYILVFLAATILNTIPGVKWKGIISVAAVVVNAIISSIPAWNALLGQTSEIIFHGSQVTGEIPVRIDALSGWFIILIQFSMVTGAFYGFQYMKTYRKQSLDITIHCIAYLLVQLSLTALCIIQNSLIFLIFWEILAFSAFMLVIFESHKQDTIRAGINYLVQSHISLVLLTVGFLWVAIRIDSYDFQDIINFASANPPFASLVLLIFLITGFAIKAGFVPFHTWLPYAHPAAPAHISGIMSGVIIKIGILGILRVLLLVKTDFVFLGYFLLVVSAISGLYGVMLAIIQHNLKKLLAYHSIENIGIIGLGIGLGTLGIGMNNQVLVTLGFAGGLLHVLNHSLFKSLLFYGAGNIYHSMHSVNLDHLGGAGKFMPHTSILFLSASLAICGLPPFNGFISEFLIYSALFRGLGFGEPASPLVLITSITALVLIGGLAILCFTKAYSAVFLGTPRAHASHVPDEAGYMQLIPMYAILFLMIFIGIMPQFFFQLLSEPLKLFYSRLEGPVINAAVIADYKILQNIGWAAAGFIALSGIIFFARNIITSGRPAVISSTWGCGYTGDVQKMQFTASSFIRSYRKLAEPLLLVEKKKIEVKGIFPHEGLHETHPGDKAEKWLIDAPLIQLRYFFDKFRFLQNGNPQYYILYGVVFISLVIGIPVLFDMVKSLFEFLTRL